MYSNDFSYDGQWDKRQGYNSNIGGGTAIGQLSEKVIDYDVRVKTCAICEFGERNEIQPKKHKCYKNHIGSAKSMESDIGVTIVNNLLSQKAVTTVVTMVKMLLLSKI